MIYLHEFTQIESADEYICALPHSAQVFEEARDYYRQQESARQKRILVLDEAGQPFYCLSFAENNAGFGEGGNYSMVHVSDFWEYNVLDETVDLELIRRGEVFVFETFEEYSYQVSRMIRDHFPDKDIFFLDPRAGFFFKDSPHLHILHSMNEFYRDYHCLISKSLYNIRSDREFTFDGGMYFNKSYTTLQMMEGLFWITNRRQGGSLNPDKQFYLIQNSLGSMGFVDMVKYVLFRLMMISKKPGEFIPVVDLGVPGDRNQFNGGSGENVWTMFFEQPAGYSPEEIKGCRNVVVSHDQQFMFNPYILEEFYYEDWALMFRKFLCYNKATREYVSKLMKETLPEHPGRILGVIGRGTDYRSSKVQGLLGTPLSGGELLQQTMDLVEEKGFDYVFLATEDREIFEQFAQSPIAGKVLCVPQERIDYSDERFKDKILIQIYRKEQRDGYSETLRYIGILEILSKKCDALIATVNCGAYNYAVARNDGAYEFARAFAETKLR